MYLLHFKSSIDMEESAENLKKISDDKQIEYAPTMASFDKMIQLIDTLRFYNKMELNELVKQFEEIDPKVISDFKSTCILLNQYGYCNLYDMHVFLKSLNKNKHIVARITKIFASLQEDFSVNDVHPNVKCGDHRIGFLNREHIKPIIGECYILITPGDTMFSTTPVVKILKHVGNLTVFKTKNSIYQVEVADHEN